MALYLVDGPPGSGKTFSCVRWMVDILRGSDRRIVTNVAVRPGRLAAWAAFGTGGAYKWPCVEAVRRFRKRIVTMGVEEVRRLWELDLAGAAVFLDELHLAFLSRNWASLPDEVIAFISEHRKGGIDFYCISQSISNVDTSFRRIAEGCWFVRNSLTEPIWPGSWLSGFKWPVQFFDCRFVLNEQGKFNMRKVCHGRNVWPVGPNKHLFRCYESFSSSSSFKALQGTKAGHSDSYDGLSWWRRLLRDFVENPVQVALLVLVVAAVIGVPWVVLGRGGDKEERAVGAPVAATVEEAEGLGNPVADALPAGVGAEEGHEAPGPRWDLEGLRSFVSGVCLVDSESVWFRDGSEWRLGEWLSIQNGEVGLAEVRPDTGSYCWGFRLSAGAVVWAERSKVRGLSVTGGLGADRTDSPPAASGLKERTQREQVVAPGSVSREAQGAAQ